MKRLMFTLGLLSLAAVLAACSGASADPGTTTPVPPGSPTGNTVGVVAKDMQFSPATITVEAGSPVQIAFDNKEGAPHNIAISDASGKNVFKGEIVSSKAITYQVPALASGTFTFICEVHPDMKGTITAQ
jgi:plastocyanin